MLYERVTWSCSSCDNNLNKKPNNPFYAQTMYEKRMYEKAYKDKT